MLEDAEMRAFLDELYANGKRQDAQAQERSKRMMNLEPDTAHFLHLLVRSSQRTRLLEIGTSNGYSTTWLAWAASKTGGHITSIDRDPRKHELADANLRATGLRDLVDFKCGDATEIVTHLPGPFDWVFFDADRYSAPAQLAQLIPKLTSGALVLADNALSHPDEIAGYLAALTSHPQFDHVILPVGKGLSLAYWTDPRHVTHPA
ncbi:MAG: class I SAM-dependent methyltransferase [Ktedonobacteraceae bacterium]